MEVTLVRASRADRHVVDRLLQLYEYDSSEWGGFDVDAEGVFPSNDTDAIWYDDYRVFLIKVDGVLAGFAFVARRRSFVDVTEANVIDEFFIMRRYRRKGVGERVARLLFDGTPGRWEAGQLPANTAAQQFWRRVIGRYTGGNYREVQLDNDQWHGPVQVFSSPPPER